MRSTPPAAPAPRLHNPQERVDTELSQIPPLDETKVRSEFQQSIVNGPVAALKEAKEKARGLLRAYNGDKDEGQTPERRPVDAAIVAMGEAAGRFTSQVRQYFTVARGEALRSVSQDPVLESTVINALQAERPETLFNQLIAVITHPVRNLQVKYLGGGEPAALSLDETQALTQLENNLVDFVKEADVKAREVLRAHLLEQYEAEEKAQKAAKAMETLNKKIVTFETPLLSLYPDDGELLSEFLTGRDVETFMMGALTAFKDLSGVQFKSGRSDAIKNALQAITPLQEAVRKYDDAFARKSRYEPIDGSSLALGECVEAARLMAEAKEEFLKDLLAKLLTAFRNLTTKDALQEDGQGEDVLSVNREKVFDDMEVKLIAAIEDQFRAEIRTIQPLNVVGMPDAVAARVEAAVAGLSGKLDQMPSQQAIVAAVMAALAPRLNAPVQPVVPMRAPTVDADAIGRSVADYILKNAASLLAQLANPSQAQRQLKNILMNQGLDELDAGLVAQSIVSLLLQHPTPAVVHEESTAPDSSGWNFGRLNVRWMPPKASEPKAPRAPMGKWTRRGLIGLGMGVLGGGAYLAEDRYDLVPDGIVSGWTESAMENMGSVREWGAELLSSSEPIEPVQVPVQSIWQKYDGGFPKNLRDTIWVRSLAGSEALPPDGFGGLIVECEGGAVKSQSQYLPMGSADSNGNIWEVDGRDVRGFQALGPGDGLSELCAKEVNGIFAAQLIPEPAAQ